ncbi:unnamed protein product [Echinostoma caproni]|uniref:Secreted protein n=1 Tax=Echinostoma caproni TaxID=27848 RepID=A0A183AA64_9TREM|nr:unnamed protein product [Echinostoma caproni]
MVRFYIQNACRVLLMIVLCSVTNAAQVRRYSFGHVNRNESIESGNRPPERAFLANRVENQKKVPSSDYQSQNIPVTRSGHSVMNAQTQKDYTSRSYSIYDNVGLDEYENHRETNEQNTSQQAVPEDNNADVNETVKLLHEDSADVLQKDDSGSIRQIETSDARETKCPVETEP